MKSKQPKLEALFNAIDDGNNRFVERHVNEDIINRTYDDQTLLMRAASQGKTEIVKALIQKGASVRTQNTEKKTALILAAQQGHYDVVQVLIHNNANVNGVDTDKKTALMYAAEQGHDQVVKLLLDNSADIEASNQNGQTALFLAARNGHDSVVKELILKNPQVVQKLDNENKTALMHALETSPQETQGRENQQNVAQYLIKSKSSKINAALADKQGSTALMRAAMNGYDSIVEQLIHENVKLNPTDNSGNTALMLAVEKGHDEIVEQLIEHGANLKGYIDLANDEGKTALMIAAASGKTKMVATLLPKNPKVNVVDEHKNTALMLAVENGHDEIVEQLIGHGANLKGYVDHKNGDGKTAFYIAAASQHENRVKMFTALKDAGADINTVDNNEKTALQTAVQSGDIDVVRELCKFNTTVNAKDKSGDTALMMAASLADTEMVKALIHIKQERGLDLNSTNHLGMSALTQAITAGKNDNA